jgi:hypothetical protein
MLSMFTDAFVIGTQPISLISHWFSILPLHSISPLAIGTPQMSRTWGECSPVLMHSTNR